MTRKRCCKLLMADWISRNEANRIMRETPGSTNIDKLCAEALRRIMVPPTLGATQSFEDLSNAFYLASCDLAKASVSIRTNHK